ncbi:hypothetical protein GLA29479_516 [Lysobacter antibioticus]|nr:hypothetical protein GLA29479_516 [Lysobacter antibioticus]
MGARPRDPAPGRELTRPSPSLRRGDRGGALVQTPRPPIHAPRRRPTRSRWHDPASSQQAIRHLASNKLCAPIHGLCIAAVSM